MAEWCLDGGPEDLAEALVVVGIPNKSLLSLRSAKDFRAATTFEEASEVVAAAFEAAFEAIEEDLAEVDAEALVTKVVVALVVAKVVTKADHHLQMHPVAQGVEAAMEVVVLRIEGMVSAVETSEAALEAIEIL